jgi:4-hydroxybenzoyl-CoA reductase subunit beta
MSLPQFDYLEPKSLRQACRVLASHKGRALAIAGGTDLLQAMKNRLKTPRAIVDLKSIPRLNQISFSSKTGLRIGALVTLRELAHNSLVVEKYPMLADAALQIGSPQLQTMGTVGGNLCQDNLCLYYNRPPMTRQMIEPCYKLGGGICHAVSNSKDCWAVHCSDLSPVLLTLGAHLVIAKPTGTATIPLDKFYTRDGLKPNILRPGQIVVEIRLPSPQPRSGGAYLKLRVRQTIDYPLLGVAVNLRLGKGNGDCQDVRVALTGVDHGPLLIPEADKLKGKLIGEAEIEEIARAARRHARPLGNVTDLAPKYRREMVQVYVRRAFQEALERAT